MGPKVKKPPKNAFFLFLEDYAKSQQEAGRHVSKKAASEECAPLWMALPEEEKEEYRKLANVHKEHSKNNKHNKFTNTGISYAEVERQQEELRLKTQKADDEIKSTISDLDYDSLKTHLFYIIHCNYYCKTDEGVYLPGEIAVSEFNLKDGIRRTYHTLINPGNVPLGYAYEAKQNIEEIHNLPYPPYEEGDSDYLGILNKILSFLEPGKLSNKKYPPLYCIENNIKASENILQALSDIKIEGKSYFRVYYLHKMFFWLKNRCVEFLEQENIGFPVISNAETEIEKDIFCYETGISCAFHATSEEKYQNCSLSVVQRFVYVVCDHCCQYLDVELVPRKHCGKNCDTNRSSTQARIDQLSQRSRYSPLPIRINESDLDGKSSYCGDMSILDWRKEGTGSFLHEELESKFSGLEISSTHSRSSHRHAKPNVPYQPRGVQREEESDDEDSHIGSIGRGSNRR